METLTERHCVAQRADKRGLRVITTFYSRGPIVKLAADHASEAVAKYVIDTTRGQISIRTTAIDSRGKPCVETRRWTGTVEQAVEQVQRECERIRSTLFGGGSGVR